MTPGRGAERECVGADVQRLAAALAHDLRTPLTALSGELELALRRDRSTGEYRDALARIRERVTELVDLTADLAFLAEPAAARAESSEPIALDVLLSTVSRHPAAVAERVTIDPVPSGILVLGDDVLLARALILVVHHAIRQRRSGAHLRLRASIEESAARTVTLMLHADAPGFLPRAWLHVTAGAPAPERAHAPGEFALRTAARMLEAYGGVIEPVPANEPEGVSVRLRCFQAARPSAGEIP